MIAETPADRAVDLESRADARRLFGRTRLAGVAASGLLIAVGLGVLVVRGAADELDRAVFRAVRRSARRGAGGPPPWFSEAVRDITALGGTTVLTGSVLASGGYLMAARKPRIAALLLASAAGASLLSGGLKAVVDRIRPDVGERLVHVSNPSFPSGHALLSAAIILTLGGLLAFAARRPSEKRLILVTALAWCVLVGWSRIWLGVHWPSDVLAGWALGAAWAAATLLVARGLAPPLTAAGGPATAGRRLAPIVRSAAD
jgi:undecaprenyl-diphosphatase